jgi:hypothetical protein
MEHIVKGSDEKDKAILAHINISIQEWLQHAYDEKARICIDRIIEVVSDRQPNKMIEVDRLAIVRELEFEPQSDKRQAKDLAQRIIATKT